MKRYLTTLALIAPVFAQTLPNAVPIPSAVVQFVDANGVPLAGGKLYTCISGLSCPGNPQATYTDSTASVPNTNPVILDSAGRAQIWIGPNAYRFVLQNANSVLQWTQDNVADTTLYFINYVKTAGTATLISYTDPASNVTTVAGELTNLYNGHFTEPGLWNDQAQQTTLNPLLGSGVVTDTMHLYMSNGVGSHRPSAMEAGIKVPSTSTTSEADAVSGLLINNSLLTNGVAGSFFSVLNSPGWSGVCTTSSTGNTVTRNSGPNFDAAWPGSANTSFQINGGNYAVATVIDGSTLTLTSNPGNQSAVVCDKRIYIWGINALLSDWQPGAPGSPSFDYGYLTNEWDFNVKQPHTILIAHSIGGNGQTQPQQALGYLVNTLGAGLMWDCGFCLLDGVARIGLQLGLATPTNNSGSQPILMYSRNAAGLAISDVIRVDGNGNLQMVVGFGVSDASGAHVVGPNPQFVFQDAAGNQILGLQGSVNLPYPLLAMGTGPMGDGGRIQVGLTNFATLNGGTPGGGMMVYCNDCKNVANNAAAPGAICVAGGNGAIARFEAGHWACN